MKSIGCLFFMTPFYVFCFVSSRPEEVDPGCCWGRHRVTMADLRWPSMPSAAWLKMRGGKT